MSNISKNFISHLKENFIIDELECVTRQISKDGTNNPSEKANKNRFS